MNNRNVSKPPILSQEKKIAFTAIEQQADELNRIGEDIWRFNEPGGKEEKCYDLLVSFLKKKGFKVTEKHCGFPTCFRAEYGAGQVGGSNHPNIGFICQYDNDPVTNNHSRGHNLMTSVSLTAALGLQTVIKFAIEKLGKITVIGCPGNEDKTGKIALLEEAAFKGIDFMMVAYPANYTKLNPCFVGAQMHKITYRGRAARDENRPWDVADPVNAAVLAYQNLAAIRHQFQPDWVVKGVITQGGTKPEVMPATSTLEFLLKAPKPTDMKVLGELLHRCFESASTASGCTLETQPMRKEFLVNVPCPRLIELYRFNANLMGSTFFNPMDDVEPENDVSNLTTAVPTLVAFYYAATSEKLGTDAFARFAGTKEGQFMSILQGKAMAMSALDLMMSESLMKEILEEHQTNFIEKYEDVCNVQVEVKPECEGEQYVDNDYY